MSEMPAHPDTPGEPPSSLAPLADWLRDRTPPIRPDWPPTGSEPVRDLRITRFSELQRAILEWLDGWRSICLPPFIEGSRVHSSDVGWFTARELGNGFAYNGWLSATGSPMLAWSGWRSQVVLPAPTVDGRLHYRFRVAGGFTGAADGTVVVAHTARTAAVADEVTATPFLTAEWQQARPAGAWASTNPAGGPQRLAADGEAVIESSIRVKAGATPEIAVGLSADILVHDGWVMLEQGDSNRLRMDGRTGRGCIDYRYVPDRLEAIVADLAELRRLRDGMPPTEDDRA